MTPYDKNPDAGHTCSDTSSTNKQVAIIKNGQLFPRLCDVVLYVYSCEQVPISSSRVPGSSCRTRNLPRAGINMIEKEINERNVDRKGN